MKELEPLVGEYVHLKTMPREAEALYMLQKVASLVKPIMRQRGWRVPILQEFYPPLLENKTRLLGLNENRGERISLRLREQYDVNQFLDFQEVTETMLHELTHNVHGPHDEKFHALLQQLREEHQQLVWKGYTGEGFLSEGKVLGGAGGAPKHVLLEDARRRARAAAEHRRKIAQGSVRKLGGNDAKNAPQRGLRERILTAIAGRKVVRVEDCGSNRRDSKAVADDAAAKGFRTKARQENAEDEAMTQVYIDLLQEDEKEKWGEEYVPASRENPAGSQSRRRHSSHTSRQKHTASSRTDSASRGHNAKPAGAPRKTLSSRPNPEGAAPKGTAPGIPTPGGLPVTQEISSRTGRPISRLVTEAAYRPHSNTSGRQASKEVNSHTGRPISRLVRQVGDTEARVPFPNSTWTCDICTLENTLDSLMCAACETDRPESITVAISAYENAFKEPVQTASVHTIFPAQSRTWVCHQCRTVMEGQWWSCSNCGTVKLKS